MPIPTGKGENFTDSERLKTPKTDCALKFTKTKRLTPGLSTLKGYGIQFVREDQLRMRTDDSLWTSYALAMLKLLGLQSFSGNCPFGSCEHNLGNEHLGSHFLSIHTELSVTLSDCELALKNLMRSSLMDRYCTNCFYVVTMYDCPMFSAGLLMLIIMCHNFNPHLKIL